MIEVVSPRPSDASRDRIEKLSEYAAFGVRYYWIVDPALRTFEIFELGADARYARALGATDGVLHDVPGREGLRLSLDALWSEIDRLQADS
jgi:Uma2 family endonuclease